MSIKKVIGLCGYSGSGKNTVANILHKYSDRYNCLFVELALAYELKLILSILETPGYGVKDFSKEERHNITAHLDKLANNPSMKEERIPNASTTRRKFLQDLGTIVRDTFSVDHFCESVGEEIDKLDKKTNLDNDPLSVYWDHFVVVITDLRYPNELAYFKSRYNFESYYINRPGLNKSGDKFKHSSETEITNLNYDVLIDNSKDLSHLEKEVVSKILTPIIMSF